MIRLLFLLFFMAFFIPDSSAQIWKKKKDEKSDSAQATKEEPKEEKQKGGSLFQKAVAKISKGAAKLGGGMTGATTSTDRLDAVEPLIFFNSNLVPKEIGTLDMDFFNGWKKGGDFVGVMFLPTDKSFFYKIDGSVKVDGSATDYQSTGVYTNLYPEARTTRTLEVETKSGEKAKFTLEAKKNIIRLVSVNNKVSGAEIDMTKDFTLQLENYSTAPGSLVRLQITGQTIGIRAWYDLGYFKPAASITIPGYIIKHVSGKGINFKNAWLQVSDAELKETKDEAGHYKEALYYYAGASSALPVKLLNEQPLFEGLKITDSRSFQLGKMSGEFAKGNANFARPFSQVKTIAASTFAVKGTTYYYDSKENKFLETKTEKEIDFPQIPDAKLDEILQNMWTGITGIMKEELGATILPAETVSATKEFSDIAPFTNQDQNTDEHFSKAYKGLKPMAMIVPIATTYKGEASLFKAAGANALLKATLNLQVSWDGKPIMQPILEVELLGEKNGGDLGLLPTKFFTAKIVGEGYRIKGGKEVTMQVINDIVRMDDLLTMLRDGLKQLKTREQQQGEYENIWNLQR